MPTLEEIKKRKQYITYANQTEEKYGLPKNLLVGVMGAESNFNPNAVSHVGAKGLMQFMKATAQEYGINPLNPSESINAAGKYLQSSYKKFGNWEDALRSYNMGVGGLQKVKAGKKSLPKETKDYVGRVYKYAGIKYEDPSYVNTSPQDNKQVQETITPTLNYFNIPKEITTFASVPDSAKEDKKETVEDGVTSKDVEEVETKTKEYNFLEALQNLQQEDYSHLQPEQVAQQQIVPQVDFNQQYEQVSQFIDEPLVAQSGGIINFYKEYINSPNYKKRLVTQGYKNPNSTINSRTNSVGSTSLTSKNGFGSQYFPSTKSINIDNNQLKNQNLPKDSTTAHEYSHAAGSMMLGYNGTVNPNLALNNKEMLLLNSKNQYNNIDTSYDSKLSMDKKIEIDHDKLPGEAKANIDALRYKLKKAGIYDTGTQDFNQNLLNKAKKLYSKDPIINRNFKAFKDKDLIYIMNNIAQNESDTDDTTQVAQQGLTWQEKLANRPRKPTVAEIIAEGDARKVQQRTQVDNTKVSNYNNARVFNPNVRNKTDKEIAQEREAKIQASVEAQKTPYTRENWRQQLASETAATGDKLRVSLEPNFFDDYINPASMIGNMASNLGQAPLQAQQSDSVMPYFTAIGTPLAVGALAGLGTQNTGQFVNNLANPLAGTGDLAKGVYNKGTTFLENNGIRTSIAPELREGLRTNGFEMFNLNSVRKPSGSIGNQGATSEGANSILNSLDIKVKGVNPNEVTLKEMVEHLKNNPKDAQKYQKFLEENPISVNELPGGEFHINDGHHRATLSYYSGKEEIPTIIKNKGEYTAQPSNNSFKSEINWANWNKEIPDNPQLIQEYNAIEQTSKSNGSWMKNPDGSKFQGTPEQFVQQNSENFKKAFSGKVNKQYHTTDKNFEVFDTTKSPSKGIFFTPDKEYSEKFTKIYKPSDEVSNTGEYYLNVNKPLNVDDPISHTTVSHYYNQRPFAAGKYDAIQGKEMDILGGKSDINVTTVFSPNQIKSAIGNSGMFDMNNPNIYKSVVPIAGASYLATQGQNKQQGGKQNYTENELAFLSEIQGIPVSSRGMYDYPNQEVIVPTNGSITMKGIPHKIKAKSLETGEEKILKPNREYYFKNTKNVLEIPFFKK